jgi:hypothetical protein
LTGNTHDGSKPYLFGLALSGGGIRSATFSLGVLQKLAGAGILKHVDYLSTVSGGGYIGSALSWWLSDRSGGKSRSGKKFDVADEFPYGTADPAKSNLSEPIILRHLRHNGKYLTPGAGISIWSGIAIVLRAVLLNLLVWVPTVAFLMLLLRGMGTLPFLSGVHGLVSMAAPDALFRLVSWISPDRSVTAPELLPAVFLLSLLVALLLAALFFVSSINFSILSWMERGPRQTDGTKTQSDRDVSAWRLVLRWLMVGILGFIDVAVFIFLFLKLQSLSGDLFAEVGPAASVCGRLAAEWPLALGVSAVLALLLAYVAHRDKWELRDWVGFVKIAAVFLLLFVLDGLLAHQVQTKPDLVAADGTSNLAWVSGVAQLVAIVGAFVLTNFWVAYGIRWFLRIGGISVRYSGRRVFEMFFGYAIPIIIALIILTAIPLVVALIDFRLGGIEGLVSVGAGAASGFWGHLQAQKKSGNPRMTGIILIVGSMLFLFGIALLGYSMAVAFAEAEPLMQGAMTGLFLLAVLTGWFANLNYISLHRFYRDRLMEAFMPDYTTVENNLTGPAPLADELRVSQLWAERGRSSLESGPFHVVNANLVLTNSSVRKYRLRGGDNFILSPLYSGSAATGWESSSSLMNGEITLATAMAISGAAANPRGGPGGRGLTRNHFVAMMMTLLSFRLGHWVNRPKKQQQPRVRKGAKRPNHFRPSGLYSIFNIGYRENNSLLELSDGGHFENLALYELIRRRCGLIIICDGGQDIESSYADFVTAIQRVGDDFGATVEFDMDIWGADTSAAAGKAFHKSDPATLIARPTDHQYPKNAEYSKKGHFVASIDYGDYGGGAWPRKGTIIYLKTSMIEELSMTAKGGLQRRQSGFSQSDHG